MAITFDGVKVSMSWQIQYSKYLTDYGFDTKKDFVDHYQPMVTSWNRVLKRFWDGDAMTDNNKGKLRDMIKEGVQLPKEIMDVLRPEKQVIKTAETTMTDEKGKKVKVKVPTTKKVSALDKLKGL